MDTTAMVSLSLGFVTFLLITVFFDIRIFEGVGPFFAAMAETIADHIGDYNAKRYIDRIKRQQVIREKENLIAKYNRLVEGLIRDYNLPFNLDSFTTTACILFAISVIIMGILIKSIPLSAIMTLSIFIGVLTMAVMQSKTLHAEKTEAIMDAEDIICPLAREGVLNAIKKVLESEEYIKDSIRPYFAQFVDNCDNNGYTFRRAILLLNRQLGPKFDNFTKKAIVFEYNERKGMADVFLDIVDENAVSREINLRKDRIFRKMNRDYLLKTGVIIAFFMYSLTVKGFREFMLLNDIGKGINVLMLSVICVGFARCQSLQGDLGDGSGR